MGLDMGGEGPFGREQFATLAALELFRIGDARGRCLLRRVGFSSVALESKIRRETFFTFVTRDRPISGISGRGCSGRDNQGAAPGRGDPGFPLTSGRQSRHNIFNLHGFRGRPARHRFTVYLKADQIIQNIQGQGGIRNKIVLATRIT